MDGRKGERKKGRMKGRGEEWMEGRKEGWGRIDGRKGKERRKEGME